MNKIKGFTLIEMLVSLVILTSIMLLSSEAYRYFVVQLNQRQDSFVSNMQQFKRVKWLQQQLSAVEMYYVGGAAGTRQLLFKGDTDTLLWISATSISQPGVSAFSGINVANGTLQYCELTLDKLLLLKDNLSQQDLCNNFQLDIVAANTLKLEYFGWLSLNAQLASQAGPGNSLTNDKPAWHGKYDGAETGTLPSVIRVTITTIESQPMELWVQLYGLNPAKTGYFSNALSN